MMKDTYVIVL